MGPGSVLVALSHGGISVCLADGRQERRLAGGTGAAESCEEGVRVVRSSPTVP